MQLEMCLTNSYLEDTELKKKTKKQKKQLKPFLSKILTWENYNFLVESESQQQKKETYDTLSSSILL